MHPVSEPFEGHFAIGDMSPVLQMIEWGMPASFILVVMLLAHNGAIKSEQALCFGSCCQCLQDRDFVEVYAGQAWVSKALRKVGPIRCGI